MSELYEQLKTPYITFQAGVDKLVDSFAGLDLEEVSPSPDKTTIFCETMWHAVYQEEEVEGVAAIAADWLKKRL